jgi:hypothetical protein
MIPSSSLTRANPFLFRQRPGPYVVRNRQMSRMPLPAAMVWEFSILPRIVNAGATSYGNDSALGAMPSCSTRAASIQYLEMDTSDSVTNIHTPFLGLLLLLGNNVHASGSSPNGRADPLKPIAHRRRSASGTPVPIDAIRSKTPSQVWNDVNEFAARYIDDWEAWLAVQADLRPELFGQILRRWQATRPLAMRVRLSDGGPRKWVSCPPRVECATGGRRSSMPA